MKDFLGAILTIIVASGWIANVYDLYINWCVMSDWSTIWGITGIFLAPLGVIFGWMYMI